MEKQKLRRGEGSLVVYNGLGKHNNSEGGKKKHTDRDLMTFMRARKPISHL